MAEYRLSPAAEHDLENIWRYTSSALYASPVNAYGKYFASAIVWGMNDIGKDDLAKLVDSLTQKITTFSS